MAKQDKYTKSARGQECQIRFPFVCNGNPETTVLAHLNGAGMGLKRANIHGAYACSSCHDIIDGRATLPEPLKGMKADDLMRTIKLLHLDGVIRTQEIMIKEGILEL